MREPADEPAQAQPPQELARRAQLLLFAIARTDHPAGHNTVGTVSLRWHPDSGVTDFDWEERWTLSRLS